jgi:CMP-N-acetylneuraminic acid synthetase
MNVLGLIPARGGSKRMPRKNLRMLGKDPLLVWTLGCGANAYLIDRLVVSSEDAEILEVARDWGVETLLRPAALATDEADSYGVMLHALDSYRERFDALCLLQPTSPFRAPPQVDQCILAWQELEDVPAMASFEMGMEVPNGAIYVGDSDWLRDGGNFDGPGVGRFMMPALSSVDIDTEDDLTMAEEMLEELGLE